AKAQEPSMEEILASIRRIIADDDATKSPPKGGEPPSPAPAPAPPTPAPPPRPAAVAPPPRAVPPTLPPPPPEPPKQVEIDAMLADLDAPPGMPARERPLPDVLDLTEAMAAPAAPPAPTEGLRTIDGQSDIVFEDRSDESEPEPPMPEIPPARFSDGRGVGLVSAATSAAVDSAFNSLAHTVLVQNARTLEDLVREMLRPLLKTWLDDNLPGLVER